MATWGPKARTIRDPTSEQHRSAVFPLPMSIHFRYHPLGLQSYLLRFGIWTLLAPTLFSESSWSPQINPFFCSTRKDFLICLRLSDSASKGPMLRQPWPNAPVESWNWSEAFWISSSKCRKTLSCQRVRRNAWREKLAGQGWGGWPSGEED